MYNSSARRLALLLIAAALLTQAIVGCSNRPAAAERLFEKGKYQEVINRYPDLEVALRARAKIAEGLLAEKKFDQVLKEYGDTPAAHRARLEKAQDLFNQGNYMMVLDSFPSSPLAATAKQRMADSLFASGQFDLLVARFRDTEQGKQVWEERGQKALNEAKKLRGDARKAALDAILREYPGTPVAKEAIGLANPEAAKAIKKK